MNQDNAVVSVFSSHAAADEAVKELSQNGFDMTRLSIVGKGYHSEEHPVGFYTVGDRIKSWGATGAFWEASGACCCHRRCSSCQVSAWSASPVRS